MNCVSSFFWDTREQGDVGDEEREVCIEDNKQARLRPNRQWRTSQLLLIQELPLRPHSLLQHLFTLPSFQENRNRNRRHPPDFLVRQHHSKKKCRFATKLIVYRNSFIDTFSTHGRQRLQGFLPHWMNLFYNIWKENFGKLQMHCSEFCEWLIHLNRNHGWFLLTLQFSTGPSKLFKFPEIVRPLPSLGGWGFRCGVSDVCFSFKNAARATVPWQWPLPQRSVFFPTWGNGRRRPGEGFGFECRLECRWGYHRVWIVHSPCRATQCMWGM